MENIGLDLANGFIKVKGGGEALCYENKLRRLKHGSYSVIKKEEQIIYEYDGDSYVLDAINGISSGGRNNQRYSSEQYLIECLVAITKVTDETEIYLTVGLPCKDYGNSELEKTLTENLLGSHVIKLNNKSRLIEIKEVNILCEPVGTLLDLIIDEDLKVDCDLENLKYLIIDLGFGTMDIIKTVGLNIEDHSHANIGSMTLIGEYLERINENYGSADIIFKEEDVTMQPKAKINKYKKEWDFSKELIATKKSVSKQVISEINKKNVAYSDFDIVVFTGGCSLELKNYLSLPSNAIIYEQSQTGNVNGYRKFGLIMKG